MPRRSVAVGLLGLVLLGGFLRVYQIGQKGFWWDELRAIELSIAPGFQRSLPVETLLDPAPSLAPRFCTTSLGDTLQGLKETFHPPFFFLLLHAWIHVSDFSEEEGTLRIPVALLGTLAIPVVFLLGKQLFSSEIGFLAATFFTISPFQIYYSQELRHYTLFSLLALLSYSVLCLIPSRKRWVPFLLGVLLAAAVYTHYVAFLLLLSQGLYMVTGKRMRSFLKRWLIACSLTVLLVSVYLSGLLLSQRAGTKSIWIWEGPLFPQLLESLVSLPIKLCLGPESGILFYRLPRPQQLFWGIATVLWISGWGIGLARWLKADGGRRESWRLLVTWLVVPAVCILGVDIVRHSVALSASRYFSFTAPALFLLFAAGFWGLSRRWRWILSLGLVLAMVLVLRVYYRDPVKEQDWKGVSAFLKTHAKVGDLLVFNQVGRPTWVAPLNALSLTYYHGTEGRPIYLTGETLSSKTEEMLRSHRRFWLIPQNRFFNEPGPAFRPVLRREFEGILSIALFERVE